jgi:hypothetical protein
MVKPEERAVVAKTFGLKSQMCFSESSELERGNNCKANGEGCVTATDNFPFFEALGL